MDRALTQILESLSMHWQLIDRHIHQLEHSEQFRPMAHSFQLIERIREQAMCTLQTTCSIERKLYRQMTEAQKEQKTSSYPSCTDREMFEF